MSTDGARHGAARRPRSSGMMILSPPSAAPRRYSLEGLAAHARALAALMRHWEAVVPRERLLTVRYEELVARQEAVTRRVAEFAGLAWEDALLAFHRTPRSVAKPALKARGLATPGGGLQPHQPKTPLSARPAATPAATPAQPAVEETINGGKAAESLAWARKLALERASCESLPKEKQHLRLTKLYAEATQAIGAVRGGEGAHIWLEYAQLQAYAAPSARTRTRIFFLGRSAL